MPVATQEEIEQLEKEYQAHQLKMRQEQEHLEKAKLEQIVAPELMAPGGMVGPEKIGKTITTRAVEQWWEETEEVASKAALVEQVAIQKRGEERKELTKRTKEAAYDLRQDARTGFWSTLAQVSGGFRIMGNELLSFALDAAGLISSYTTYYANAPIRAALGLPQLDPPWSDAEIERTDWGKRFHTRAGEIRQHLAETHPHSVPSLEDIRPGHEMYDFAQWAAGTGINQVPLLATSSALFFGGGVAGTGKATSLWLATLPSMAQIREETYSQLEARIGKDPKNKDLATLVGMIGGAVDRLPLGMFFNRTKMVDIFKGKVVYNVLKRKALTHSLLSAIKQGPAEAVPEMLQEVLMLMAVYSTDENKEMFGEDWPELWDELYRSTREAGAAAFLFGSVMGGASGYQQARRGAKGMRAQAGLVGALIQQQQNPDVKLDIELPQNVLDALKEAGKEVTEETGTIFAPYKGRDLGGLMNQAPLQIAIEMVSDKHPAKSRLTQVGNFLLGIPLTTSDNIQADLTYDKDVYNKLPKEMRKKVEDIGKGIMTQKFFDLMDQESTPAEIDAMAERGEIDLITRDVAKFFRHRYEAMRLDVRDTIRDGVRGSLSTKTNAELVADIKSAGLEGVEAREETETRTNALGEEYELTVTKFYEAGTETEVKKANVIRQIAELQIPENWGHQYAYVHHIFTSSYDLSWIDEKGEKHRIPPPAGKEIRNLWDAKRALENWKEIPENLGLWTAFAIEPRITMPLDILRVSKGRYYRFISNVKQAADIESQAVAQDVTRGIIGKRGAKQKFWAARLPREGLEGYTRDFWRAHQAYIIGYHKWKEYTNLRKLATPLIEDLRNDGYTRWANALEDRLEYTWGRKRSIAAESLDDLCAILARHLPFEPLRNWMGKPFKAEGIAATLKSINYYLHLQTPKFMLMQEMQLAQTLYPIIGYDGMAGMYRNWKTPEWQAILKKYNVLGPTGKLKEAAELGALKGKWLPAAWTEARNQQRSFLAIYDLCVNKLGMKPDDAAELANLKGRIWTQFAHTPADRAKLTRGNLGSVLLQYKHFGMKNLGMGLVFARHGQMTPFARWLGAQIFLGGAKGALATLPFTTIAGVAHALGLIGVKGPKALLSKLKDKVSEELGEDAGNMFNWGIFAALNIDLSQSISMIDAPRFKDTRDIPEGLAKMLGGPWMQTLIRGGYEMFDESRALPMGKPERAARFLGRNYIVLRQARDLIKVLNEDATVYDHRERVLYKLKMSEQLMRGFGFRSLTEAGRSEIIDILFETNLYYNRVMNQAAQQANAGNWVKALEIVRPWNATTIGGQITPEDITKRGEKKMRGYILGLGRLERGLEQAPKNVQQMILEQSKEARDIHLLTPR